MYIWSLDSSMINKELQGNYQMFLEFLFLKENCCVGFEEVRERKLWCHLWGYQWKAQTRSATLFEEMWQTSQAIQHTGDNDLTMVSEVRPAWKGLTLRYLLYLCLQCGGHTYLWLLIVGVKRKRYFCQLFGKLHKLAGLDVFLSYTHI